MPASVKFPAKFCAVAIVAAAGAFLRPGAAAEPRDPCAAISKQAERLAEQVEMLAEKRGAVESRLSSKPRGDPGSFNPNGDDSLRMIIGRQADAEAEKDRIDRKLAECEARQVPDDVPPPSTPAPSVKKSSPAEDDFSSHTHFGQKEGDEWTNF